MTDNINDFAVNSARWLSVDDFKGEVWRNINAYKGVYMVSNMGRVKSLKNGSERILRFSKWANYYRVKLSIEGITKDYSVHRLVANTFLENPNSYQEVDHINGFKSDNRTINLRFVSHNGNMYNPNTIYKTARSIEMVTEDNVVAAIFPSIAMASMVMGIPLSTLRDMLYKSKNGIKVKYGGYHFRYTKKSDLKK